MPFCLDRKIPDSYAQTSLTVCAQAVDPAASLRLTAADHMQRRLAPLHGLHRQAAVQRGKPAAMHGSQRQQIRIGHLPRRQNTRRIDPRLAYQADVVRSEDVAIQPTHLRHDRRHRGRRPRRPRIARMADNADNAILRQRARGPRRPPLVLEPAMHRVVAHMGRIDQCNQHIHVQQKPQSSK